MNNASVLSMCDTPILMDLHVIILLLTSYDIILWITVTNGIGIGTAIYTFCS